VTQVAFVACSVEREGCGGVGRRCAGRGPILDAVGDGNGWGDVKRLDRAVDGGGHLMPGDFVAARLNVVRNCGGNSEGLGTERTIEGTTTAMHAG